MKTKQLKIFGKDCQPKQGVSNNYDTRDEMVNHPVLMFVSAVRNSGKSYTCASFMNQCKKDKIYDRTYIICPTYVSNREYYQDHINDEDVYEPERISIQEVINKVNDERDQWQEFLHMLERYEQLVKTGLENVSEEELFDLFVEGIIDMESNLIKPTWKYNKDGVPLRPPQSCLILDDCLGSKAIGPDLTKLATLNRHVAQIKSESKHNAGRTACGLSVIILSQTYRMVGGLGRAVRENLTDLILFENKSEKILKCIKEEMCSCVSEEDFDLAYDYAVQERYDNLLISFYPKDEKYRFRRNLNELIII